jgi:hypothetical protein
VVEQRPVLEFIRNYTQVREGLNASDLALLGPTFHRPTYNAHLPFINANNKLRMQQEKVNGSLQIKRKAVYF